MSTTNVSATVQLYSALHEAIFNDAALAILYNTNGDITKSRVVHPVEIAVGKKGSDLLWAHDSIRDAIISFRLDRIIAFQVSPSKERM